MSRFTFVVPTLRRLSPRSGLAFALLFPLANLGLGQAPALPPGHPAIAPVLSADDLAFFESKVRPVLVNHCYKCHSEGADKVKGGLLLDSRDALLLGGNSGPALVAGKPDESLLIQAIRYQDEDLQMPPKGEKLSAQDIATLTEWVRRGAPDPRTAVRAAGTDAYRGVGRAHWAFQPVKKPAVPATPDTASVRSPIDAFVQAKLAANGLSPNRPADKATLIRRVYFDLVGLPPTVREVQAFLDDHSPDAFARVVDRLLASPHYGERWARYWLDVARYADTKGDPARQEDVRLPHAWTYRDWVIDALNADLPYDQFILAQLAGDRLQAGLEKQARDKRQPLPETRWPLAAMGFLTLGNTFDGRRDDVIGDQIDVTSKAFLGLTVACARCHDHKFDPISTKDYYSLHGVFANSQQPRELPTLHPEIAATAEYADYLKKSADLTRRETELKTQQEELRRMARASGKAKGAQPDPMKRRELVRLERELQRDIADLEANHPGAPARAHALYDVPARSLKDSAVLIRGEAGNRGDVVPRRFLEILSPDPKNRPVWKTGSGRLELARAIADPKNPLTARVMVNRVWQQHFGRGFVSTPDDFGNMSAPPTHPELLDWLAATFVESGWSIKQLHRTILLSSTYQQSSQTNPAYAEKDPDNLLLWRFNLRRLGFEELHDSLLAIAGELDLTVGGKPVPISSQDFARRRALYTLIDRRNPPELLTQFDFPSPDVSSGRRYETTVPQQALFLMNSPLVIETARKLVERASFSELKSDSDRVTVLYLAIFQRLPSPTEVQLALSYVRSNPQGTGLDLPAPSIAAQKISAKEARKNERQAASKKGAQGRFSTQVGGTYESAAPLNAWTKLAHALFQSNEAMFYN